MAGVATDPEARQALLEKRRNAAKTETRPEVEKPLIEGSPFESKPKAEDAAKTAYRPGALVKPLTSFYETIGGFVILADRTCGQAIIDSAEGAATSLDELARTNPRVRKVLMRLVESGAVTKVVIAHLPIIMVVLAHHFPNALKYVSTIITGVKADSE